MIDYTIQHLSATDTSPANQYCMGLHINCLIEHHFSLQNAIFSSSISRKTLVINDGFTDKTFREMLGTIVINHARRIWPSCTTWPMHHELLNSFMSNRIFQRIWNFSTNYAINIFRNWIFIIRMQKYQYMCMWKPLFWNSIVYTTA